MEITDKTPNVPLAQFKKTKIIATVGPATHSYALILELVKAGANGLRLNCSHGTHEERIEQINWIRQASLEYGKPVAIIQDLQGPKIRLGDFGGTIEVNKGETVTLQYGADYAKTGHIPTQYDLSTKVKPGERLYLYDGRVRSTVSSVKDDLVLIHVENSGALTKRKGINLPDTDFGGDILTKKDKDDISFGVQHDVDYVALSFVQRAEDIENLRRILRKHGSDARIIAKIETVAAVQNLEEIVKASDAIMVARGDLAIETEPESVPIVQRKSLVLA